jgi:hypothetical protein
MKSKKYRQIMKFDIVRTDMASDFKGSDFKFASACLEISDFGGLFFVCKNFRSKGTHVFEDKVLANNIMVFKSNGDVYARLTLRDPNKPQTSDSLGNIIGAKFIRYEKILLLFDTSKYLVFCPSSNKVVHTGELTPKGFFSPSIGNSVGIDLNNEIVGMTTFEDSMAFWTRGGALYLIQDIYKGERTKLMDNMLSINDNETYIQDLALADHNRMTTLQPRTTGLNRGSQTQFPDIENFSFEIFPDPLYPGSKKRFFVFPHITNGLWVLSWNGQSVSKKRILERIVDPILHVRFSYKKRRLAVLTETLKLEIHQINDLWREQISIVDSIQLEKQKVDLDRLRGLDWIKDYVVCFCYIDRVHFLVVGAEKSPSKFIKATQESKMDRLFYKTEIDGLRVIFMSSDPTESENLLYKIKSKAVMDTENISSIHEAAFLLKWFQTVSGVEGVRMMQRDLRKEQDKLLNAISTILKAIKFKDHQDEMNPLLKAAAFGKLYITNEDDTKKYADKIFDMVKLIKVWSSWKKHDQRSISFKQFFYLGLKKNPNRPFRDLLDLLIHNGSFALAKNVINLLIKDRNAINYLLRPWAKRIMDVKLKDYLGDSTEDVEVTVAHRIRFLFRELSLENPNVKASEILEIAEDALKRNYKILAKELLKIENPPILKIGFFLKMEEFESALEESVHCNDSHYIYLIFKKFCGHISQSSSSKFPIKSLAFKIQSLNNKILAQHLINFLELSDSSNKEEIIETFRNPFTYLISSEFKEEIESVVDENIPQTSHAKRKFYFDLFERSITILDKVVTRSRENKMKSFSQFIDKRLKPFYYYFIVARELEIHHLMRKNEGAYSVGPAQVVDFIIDSNEDYNTEKKYYDPTLKEFKDKNRGMDFQCNLGRVKNFIKKKQFTQAANFIKNMKLFKVRS